MAAKGSKWNSEDALRELLEQRLRGTVAPDEHTPCSIAGLTPAEASAVRDFLPTTRIPAAVLLPIVDTPEGLILLLTQRSSNLRRHPGQISLPGGRIEAGEGPLEAALRETEEEIGLSRDSVRVLGFLEPQMIFTGYCVSPVVGLVQPGFELRLDPREVAEVFEAPLSYVLDPSNHVLRKRELGRVSVQAYDISYGDYRIWGATAGILMSLYRLLTR